jgi:alcohol dehydrogenase (cytochrome c)/quinohemoprotein ethanol dehydrogenase
MSHGRTYNEQRYSPLKQINTQSIGQLGLAWFADFDTNRGQESTPIVVDGVIYVTTAWSKVKAYNGKTGQVLWEYDPRVPGEWGVNTCCDVVNRGAAVWNGKVFIGTLDGRLIAIDAASGKPVWDVSTIDKSKPYSITGAPRVIKGKVLVGQAGAEFGVRGYISAYDADTGKMLWRWYTVPGNPAEGFENKQMEMAAGTWKGEWWKTGGGGTVWDAITYDPQTDLVFVGVGNGSPWPSEIRSPGGGDNLFLSSIVALKADTGEYAWHYQTTPADSWDYTATQQIMIADLQIAGRKRHVVMQAPKNGIFYVLDAASGELLSAKPFIPINWASGVDMKTGRPIENPAARYDKTGKGFILIPGPGGAHSWHPMSFNPETGLVYIPAMHTTYPMVASREDDNPMGQRLSISMSKGFAMYNDPKAVRINNGLLLAWDPVNQKEVWRVTFEDGRGGGTLTTAGGLVFQGNSKQKEFVAYRADNGERLWAMPVHTGIVAGAVSYEVEGEQYVAVVSGSRIQGNYYAPNYSRLLVFKLNGTAALPPAVETPPLVLNPPPPFGTAEVIGHGEQTYNRFCGTCHGTDGQSRGLFPDLRYSAALGNEALFDSIVLEGALSANGMVSFRKALSKADVDAIRAYMVARAHHAVKHGPGGFAAFGPAAGQRQQPTSQAQPAAEAESTQPRSAPSQGAQPEQTQRSH